MKKLLLFLTILVLFGSLSSCRDKCKETRLVLRQIPIYHPFSEIRGGVDVAPAREIQDPGKVFVQGNYLFINEIKQGVHVIDNSDPANPRFISFIKIPGNGDIVVRDNILYADSYTDIVAIDIRDPAHAMEVGRVHDVFYSGSFNSVQWSAGQEGLFIGEYNEKYETETFEVDCEDNTPVPVRDMVYTSTVSEGMKSVTRFAFEDKFLYSIVNWGSFGVFDLGIPAKPVSKNRINTESTLFSIVAYRNKLFLGSQSGTVLYDNTDPAMPKKISNFPQGAPCDQVTIQDDIAYVTTRTSSFCGSIANKLDVIDISDSKVPKRVKSYRMENPRATLVDFPTLYLCEGESGLKVFDVRDPMEIDKHLLSVKKDIVAYGVVSLGKTILVTGKDCFYQFDTTNPAALREISKIPIKKATR
ncbi:hypothetical protein [Dyadobacter sp. LHD-138]|uniref:LVIVD repeat-containing protein n=1 Tax=Dyadobacter sp. LHD-138 TaxID=3071413 RepID=UPI0027DF9088|nr:hypothetical protein [Dyadobacter sp. LHD-138]MDQ6480402.1 hypothetical protein [Dyadobacter sp. LHD-138]